MKVKKKLLARVSAGLLAIVSIFSIIVGALPTDLFTIKASAATTYIDGEMGKFITIGEILKETEALLGKSYVSGGKGANTGVTPATLKEPKNITGFDCSGLVYYIYSKLGVSTSGFSYQNPMPVNTNDWITKTNKDKYIYVERGNKTYRYLMETSNINNVTNDKGNWGTTTEWWKDANGKTLEAGSIVIAHGGSGENHAWIYLGEFKGGIEEVVDTLVDVYGLSRTVVEKHTFKQDGSSSKHWRIECSGSSTGKDVNGNSVTYNGVTINNGITAKQGATAYNLSTFKVPYETGNLRINKSIKKAGATNSPVLANSTNYPNYSKIKFELYDSEGKLVAATKKEDGLYEVKDDSTTTTFVLGKTGTLEINRLPVGEYTVKETTDFTSLNLKKSANKTVTITKDGTTTDSYTILNWTNYEAEGAYMFQKWLNDRPIHMSYTGFIDEQTFEEFNEKYLRFYITNEAGDKYYVFRKSNVNADTYEYIGTSTARASVDVTNTAYGTDLTLNAANSIIKTTGLPIGKYKLYETTAFDTSTGGYYSKDIFTQWNIKAPSDEPVATFTITNGSTGTPPVNIYNEVADTSNVEITKYVDAIDGSTFVATSTAEANVNAKVRFILKDYNGKFVTATTDADGKYVFSGVVDSNTEATAFELDDNGKFFISELPACPTADYKYTLIETETAEGYEKAKDLTFTVASGATHSDSVLNTHVRTELSIRKDFEMARGQATDEMYALCEFRVKNSEGKWLVLDENYALINTTDVYEEATVIKISGVANPTVKVTNLIEDKYTVIETMKATSNGYYPFEVEGNAEKEVEVTANGTNSVSFVNIEKRGSFLILKVTDTLNNVEGIRFRVYGTSDAGQDIDVTSDATDVEGRTEILSIPTGTYTIEEVASSVLNCFNIAPSQKITITGDETVDNTSLSFKNTFKKGEVTVRKEGDKGEKLAGAEFTILAAEDIYIGNEVEENLLYKKGDVITVVTTNNEGVAKTNKDEITLPYNYDYEIYESKAPHGYNTTDARVTFTLTENNGVAEFVVVNFTETIAEDETPRYAEGDKLSDILFVNDKQYGSITIYKTNDAEEKVYLEGAVFNILAEDKKTVVDTVTTSSFGFAVIEGLEVDKTYYVQEVTAPVGYVLDKSYHEITLDYDVNLKYIEETISIENSIITNNVVISKTDIADDALLLPNCEIEITDLEKNQIDVGTTNELGICEFILPYGVYYFHELTAPEGYLLDDKYYMFDVSEDGVTAQYGLKDEKIKGGISITKTDLDDSAKLLAGCTVEILDRETMKQIGVGTTDENGLLTFTDIEYGCYYYHEVEAPEGYLKDDTLYPFEITEHGVISEFTLKNERITGEVQISKTDVATGDLLAGATFDILDEAGNVVATPITDEDGMFIVTLGYGKYTIIEKSAPSGYVLDKTPYEFEITEDGVIIEKTITNAKEIKTGLVNTTGIKPIFFTVFGGVGIVGCIALLIVSKKIKD